MGIRSIHGSHSHTDIVPKMGRKYHDIGETSKSALISRDEFQMWGLRQRFCPTFKSEV